MCGKRLKKFLCGLVALLLLSSHSCFSVELSEEEWAQVKNSYQILEIVTNERDNLTKDKESLMQNNETIMRDNEKLWNDNVKLSARNESLEKENGNLRTEKEKLSADLEKSLKVSKLEGTLKTVKWCAITAILTALGMTVYNMNT